MYPLTPLIHDCIKKTLNNPKQIREWLGAFGSPLNLVYPKTSAENLQRFQNILRQNRIKGNVFYAHKANKSQAIVRELALHACGIDVASEGELVNALCAGFNGSRIEATGPKNESFLRLALLHGAIINLNDADELARVRFLREKLALDSPTPIFVRLQGFSSSRVSMVQKDSKFGWRKESTPSLLNALHTEKDELQFLGFSFHLATTSERERVLAIEQALRLTLEAMKYGLEPKGINIGGGLSVNYLQFEKEWHRYVVALKESLLQPEHAVMTWNKTGLGFWAEKGTVRGSAHFSDFYRSYDQFQELERVLKTPIPELGTPARFLEENMLALYLEPGRSLLDQAGVTLARVISTNRSFANELVCFLDMNRSHLNAMDLEFMSDPIIITDREEAEPATEGIFLSGNLCLPHDFICRRKVFLPLVVKPGDILAFINTAGYYMDFTESNTTQQPIAQKLAVHGNGWSLDERYDPLA